MCLFPRLIYNPKYKPTKKRPNPPICTDERLKYVSIGCGNCMECRKQKANGWRVRLLNEIKNNKFKYFVTLTFSEESLTDINGKRIIEANATAGFAVRHFLERWRKKYKKSLRHWFITELGHENTERIHLHGFIFSEFEITNELLESIWQYGRTDTGKYVNERSVNYIIKYVTKIDQDHKGFVPEIFTSSGIGANYVNTHTIKYHNTERDYYRLNNGAQIALPIYYRNKFFNEQQREELWIKRIEEKVRYVNGIKIDVRNEKGEELYYRILQKQQEINKNLGFGDTSKEWKKLEYNARYTEINRKMKKN